MVSADMNLLKTTMALSLGFALCSCVGTDEVLFVTDTNIGIDADSKPPNLGIAYDRIEGYIAPSYDNGALPPVLARIQSNLNPFDPVVKQVYATGKAAELLSQQGAVMAPDRELSQRNKRVAYFITASSVGLRVTFMGNLPDSVHLGYKRKEFSYIPIGTTSSGHCVDEKDGSRITNTAVDCYASVLANIQLGGQISDINNSNLQVNQLVATGAAAEHLAAENSDIRHMFIEEILKSDIEYEDKCDQNCEKIRTYRKNNGPSAIQTKCLIPDHITYITDLYYLDKYKDARTQCVKALPA
jgi:hypothetical protein